MSVLLGSFLTSAVAYLVAAVPSVQLACTVRCANTDLSPNTTRTLSASRLQLEPTSLLFYYYYYSNPGPIRPSSLQDCNFQTTHVEKTTAPTAQCTSQRLA